MKNDLLKPPVYILTAGSKISRKNFNIIVEKSNKERITILSANNLDSRLGTLHTKAKNQPSLSLDFLDLIRTTCDRFAISLINRKQVDKNSFDFFEEKVLLNQAGRKIVLKNFIKPIKSGNFRDKMINYLNMEAKNYINFISQ